MGKHDEIKLARAVVGERLENGWDVLIALAGEAPEFGFIHGVAPDAAGSGDPFDRGADASWKKTGQQEGTNAPSGATNASYGEPSDSRSIGTTCLVTSL
jgi:hypothetical protein